MADPRSITEGMCLTHKSTILDAIESLSSSGSKIILILNDQKELVGTVTSGDLRRYMSKDEYLKSDEILNAANTSPVTVTCAKPLSQVIEMMLSLGIDRIPVIETNKLVGIYYLEDCLQTTSTNLLSRTTLVIMAGGLGKRLRPLTDDTPKPMLELNGRPILEHLILKAKAQGIKNFIISVGYLADVVKNYFKSGKSFGVQISYVEEKIPLGTAGALSLIKQKIEGPVIVINGDVLSNIDYEDLMQFHNKRQASATLVVREHKIQNPYGTVVIGKDDELLSMNEKPTYISWINSGIYVVNSSEFLNLDMEHLDMPDFLTNLSLNRRVKVYVYRDYWIDIGSKSDFQRAESFITINNS